MNWPRRTGFKTYFFIFFWLLLGSILSLVYPATDVYKYYHIMGAFHAGTMIHHRLALASAGLTALALFPLFAYAFGLPRRWLWFFKPLFFARILADILGHNYEWQFLKGELRSEPFIALTSLVLFCIVMLPSYQAHFLYAFRKDPQ